jgi:hypothetical protein
MAQGQLGFLGLLGGDAGALLLKLLLDLLIERGLGFFQRLGAFLQRLLAFGHVGVFL